MRKIITFYLLLFNGVLCYSQGGIVTAPILEGLTEIQNASLERQAGIAMTMSSVIKDLERAEREFKAAMQKATWMRDLQSAQRLLYMIENLVCTSRNLNIKISGGHSSCLVEYRYDISIAKLQMSADYLGILLTDGISLSHAERMQVMATTQEKFEEANYEFVKLGEEMDAQNLERQINQSIYNDIQKFIYNGKPK